MRNLKYVYWVLLGLFVVALLSVAISEVVSFDVFWQLQSGKYMWQTKSFIRTDTFTLASDVPRSEHTWLHSLALYATYSLAGYDGISVLKGLLLTLTCVTLVGTARVRQSSWPAIFLILPFFLVKSGAWLERPQLWTFLFFSLFLLFLERHRITRSWRILWLLPVSLVWFNAHFGSILAFAILLAYIVGEAGQALWQKEFRAVRLNRILTVAGGVALGTFLSPYPSKIWKTLLHSSKMGTAISADGKVTGSTTALFNIDWTATTFQGQPFFYYSIGITLLILVLGFRKLRLTDLFLLAGLCLMGSKLVRHIPFFYMGLVAILPRNLDGIAELFIAKLPFLVRRVGLACLLLLSISLFSFQWYPLMKGYGLFNTGLREWHYPIKATEFVREHNLAPNIYNTYDWGGYMAWQLFPEYQVFWDGRQNSAEMFNLGFDVMVGRPGWDRILDRFDVRTIVTRASTFDTGEKFAFLDKLKNRRDWHLVFNSESSMVFVKEGSLPADWIRRFSKPKWNIDDTVLAEAHLMVRENPGRYMAWWEMSQIYQQRYEYQYAFAALKQHLRRAPRPAPGAEPLYRKLSAMFESK